jgi:exopolysaccharide biosynthesis polyprenyl glycosylphosphotransferase
LVRKSTFLRILLLVGDASILVGSVMAAYWIRFNTGLFRVKPVQDVDLYYSLSVVFAIVGVLGIYLSEGYRPKGVLFNLDIFFSILRTTLVTFVIGLAVTSLLRGYLSSNEIEAQSRLVLIAAWTISTVTLSAWRAGINLVLRHFRRRGLGLNQVLIVGADPSGRRFFDAICENPHLGYKPIGFLDGAPMLTQIEPALRLGASGDLEDVIQRRWVDQVVVTSRYMEAETVARLMAICERADIQFSMVPEVLDIATVRSRIHEVAGIPVVTVEDRIYRRWNRAVKRAADLGVGTLLVLLTSPVLLPLVLAVAVAISLESPGPVLFRQRRVGKGGRPFSMLKFRSMCEEAEELRQELADLNDAQGPLFKMRQDPRVTRVGRIIRRYSIDELPQLINVFKGNMALVGPRPPLLSEVELYQGWQTRRFDVQPGIVGLPQVSGRSRLTFDEVIRLDLYYIDNWSLLMDLKILLKSIPAVLHGRGAY